jgi:hypothetical protein
VQPEPARKYAPNALPSVAARVAAFVAILVGGLCGGLIGYSVSDIQCGGGDTKVVIGPAASSTTTTTVVRDEGDGSGCGAWNGGSGVLGAIVGAGGTGIVAVLVLRAMSEWRRDLDVDEAPDS